MLERFARRNEALQNELEASASEVRQEGVGGSELGDWDQLVGMEMGQEMGIESSEETSEKELFGGQAKEFLAKRFPNLSESALSVRAERIADVGMKWLEVTEDARRNMMAGRGEQLPEDYHDKLSDGLELQMGRILGKVYGEDSRLTGDVQNDNLSEDEEAVWSLATEAHKPGTLDLVDLFMSNPRHEEETADDYKQRLHNYTRHDSTRQKQLAEDAKYLEAHPKEVADFNELKAMYYDSDLRNEYPRALKMMEVARYRPEKAKYDEDGDLDMVWFYQAVPRGEKETIAQYYGRVTTGGYGLTEAEARQFAKDQMENARAMAGEETAENKEQPKVDLLGLREQLQLRMKTCEDADLRQRFAEQLGRLEEKIAAGVKAETKVA